MPLNLTLKSGPDEVVEFFACSDPTCRSHAQGNPAVVIKWNENETSRLVPCGFCYWEEWVASQVLGEDAKCVPHGIKMEAQRGQGEAVVRRDSLTYELLEIISKKS